VHTKGRRQFLLRRVPLQAHTGERPKWGAGKYVSSNKGSAAKSRGLDLVLEFPVKAERLARTRDGVKQATKGVWWMPWR